MYKNRRIGLVIPAYNVVHHIEDVVKTLPQFVDRVVLVDDCGTDGTTQLLEMLEDARTVVVRHSVNQGSAARWSAASREPYGRMSISS